MSDLIAAALPARLALGVVAARGQGRKEQVDEAVLHGEVEFLADGCIQKIVQSGAVARRIALAGLGLDLSSEFAHAVLRYAVSRYLEKLLVEFRKL